MDIPNGDGDRHSPGDMERERMSVDRRLNVELGGAPDTVVPLPGIVPVCLADDVVSSYAALDAYCKLE